MRWIVTAVFTSAVVLAWLWGPNLVATATAEAAAQQQAPKAEQEAVAETDQDEPDQVGADQDGDEPAEEEPAEEASSEEASAGSGAPRGESKSEGLEVFVPTEKLPAGSSVSFPVDI